jgi:hypothetical protein
VAITPNSWDDHGIHLREHNDYRKTQEFLTADPDVKRKFEFHCQQHENQLQQALAKQVAMQQALQGGQPQGPQGPQRPRPPAAAQSATDGQ